MWLVVGNKYIQLSNGLEEVAELDEFGGLTVEGWSWEDCVKCLKRGWNEKMGMGKQKIWKAGGGGHVGYAFEWLP